MPPSEGDSDGSVDSAEGRHRRRLLRRLAREGSDEDGSVTADESDGASDAGGGSDVDEDEDDDNEGSNLDDIGSNGSEEESGSERGGSDDDTDNGGSNGGVREDEGFERPWRLRRGVWTRERRWWQPPSMVRVRSPRRRGGAACRTRSNGGARRAGQSPLVGDVVDSSRQARLFGSCSRFCSSRQTLRGAYPPVTPHGALLVWRLFQNGCTVRTWLTLTVTMCPQPFAMRMTGYVGVVIESDPSASSVQVALSLRASAHVLRLWVPTAHVTRVGELPPRDDNGASDAANAKRSLRRVPPQVLRQALAVLAAQRLLLSVRDGAATAYDFIGSLAHWRLVVILEETGHLAGDDGDQGGRGRHRIPVGGGLHGLGRRPRRVLGAGGAFASADPPLGGRPAVRPVGSGHVGDPPAGAAVGPDGARCPDRTVSDRQRPGGNRGGRVVERTGRRSGASVAALLAPSLRPPFASPRTACAGGCVGYAGHRGPARYGKRVGCTANVSGDR